MPFSGNTFSEIEQARVEVAEIISRNKRRLDSAKAEFGRIVTDMTAEGNEYAPIVAASATLLATDPSNAAFVVLNESIQKHLADFNAVSGEASAIDAALNA